MRREILAFSIFCNDYTGGDNSARLIDQIVLVLASDPDSRLLSGQKTNNLTEMATVLSLDKHR